MYVVIEDPASGTILKLPGRISLDPSSGQIETVFEENPQLPFNDLRLELFGGQRAPLRTPAACGTYTTRSTFTPWSANGDVSEPSDFEVTEGCGGGFNPKLTAGTQNPLAGTTSPFSLRLTREDGEAELTGLTDALPLGLSGYLKGIPYCPDGALAAISGAEGTGRAQEVSPSCPAASQIGTVTIGAGAGTNPFYVTSGKAYLAGPYKGAPLSLAAVIPAVAGPFDLGSVMVRTALRVDPETARITAVSDPFPTILHGIPVDARDIRLDLNREHFTLNPTSCEPLSMDSTVTGSGGASAALHNHFQAAGCERLSFKPKLAIQLKGATKRLGHPALRAVLKMPEGGANVARAQVNLPHGEFLDQGNLNKTCTKPVLLAGNCPASSVYGTAKAWTPLLAAPLEGNVYLVGGYGYKLPALVAELDGQIRVLLVGKVDSGKNKGIRNTFELVPDAPVEKFELQMKGGGKYGLLENSEDLCRAPKAKRRAIVAFTGQNGTLDEYKPVVQNGCGKKHGKRKKHKKHHR
jgi:hypothetical protein